MELQVYLSGKKFILTLAGCVGEFVMRGQFRHCRHALDEVERVVRFEVLALLNSVNTDLSRLSAIVDPAHNDWSWKSRLSEVRLLTTDMCEAAYERLPARSSTEVTSMIESAGLSIVLDSGSSAASASLFLVATSPEESEKRLRIATVRPTGAELNDGCEKEPDRDDCKYVFFFGPVSESRLDADLSSIRHLGK